MLLFFKKNNKFDFDFKTKKILSMQIFNILYPSSETEKKATKPEAGKKATKPEAGKKANEPEAGKKANEPETKDKIIDALED